MRAGHGSVVHERHLLSISCPLLHRRRPHLLPPSDLYPLKSRSHISSRDPEPCPLCLEGPASTYGLGRPLSHSFLYTLLRQDEWHRLAVEYIAHDGVRQMGGEHAWTPV